MFITYITCVTAKYVLRRFFNETLCYNEALKSPTDNTDS
jgi:hypothetical protein